MWDFGFTMGVTFIVTAIATVTLIFAGPLHAIAVVVIGWFFLEVGKEK